MNTQPLIQPREGHQRVSVTLSELLELAPQSKLLSLASLHRTSRQAGQHTSPLLARGMEFVESRRYQPGDDIRNIDWRVTARTGKAHTKLFAQEKEKKILVAVDLQAPMFFATRGVFKSVQASLMMAMVAWSAALGGDRIGGLVFEGGSDFFESRPALGKRGVFPFLHGLAEKALFTPQKMERSEAQTSEAMDKAITHLQQVATPGSLIFFASDFRNLSDYGQNILMQIGLHSDLCLCFIYDRAEKELPTSDCFAVKNGGRELQVDARTKASQERYKQAFMARRRKVASLASHSHIHYIECSTEENYSDILIKHFSKRK